MKKNEVLTREISNIWRNNKSKRRDCIVDGCGDIAINSHILQKNGIISLICEDRHFYVLELVDFYKIQSPFDMPVQYRRIGINEGLSFPLFCNQHDSDLFNEIEIGEYDPYTHKSQILFSYRSVCKELRKKEIQIDIQGSMLNNPVIRTEFDNNRIEITENMLRGYIAGAKDLKFYQKEIESELKKIELGGLPENKFTFVTITIEKIDVCTSSIFSPINSHTTATQEEPFNSVFISIFPKGDDTIIICGYHNKYSDEWMQEYVKSWSSLSKIDIQKRISEILILRCETWGMSPSLYNLLGEDKRQAILHDFAKNVFNQEQELETEINIFDN